MTWTELPALPDEHGFAGPFVGVSGGALIVAGGANFPDARPWNGGTKTWTDRAFVLAPGSGSWHTIEHALPRPLGYGVSITTEHGLICIGGSTPTEHRAEAFELRITNNQLTRRDLPPLPAPCANMAGLRVGQTIYVIGGSDAPTATHALNTFYALDLTHLGRGWQTLPPLAGAARILPGVGELGGSIYVFSGAELLCGDDGKPTRRFLRDAWRYDPAEKRWTRLADLPRASVAAPTPALVRGDELLLLGGDDGQYFFVQSEVRDEHPGFSREILAYNPRKNVWSTAGELPGWPAVTTTMVRWGERWVIPTGEIRPGVRTNRVMALER